MLFHKVQELFPPFVAPRQHLHTSVALLVILIAIIPRVVLSYVINIFGMLFTYIASAAKTVCGT